MPVTVELSPHFRIFPLAGSPASGGMRFYLMTARTAINLIVCKMNQ